MEPEPIRLILADDNIDFCNTVVDYFEQQEDIEVIETAHNGVDAYEKIIARKPDVIILDGIMPQLDGLGVLEKLNKEESRPTCIMISSMHTNVTQYAFSLGAEYFIIKPFELDTLAQRIRMLRDAKSVMAYTVSLNSDIDLETWITNFLNEIGIPLHLLGRNYMHTALVLSVNNTELLHYLTKELYPTIAKKYKTSSSSVESAIRTTIDVLYKREKKSSTNNFFRDSFSHCEGKPTNGEFIAVAANRICLLMRKQ